MNQLKKLLGASVALGCGLLLPAHAAEYSQTSVWAAYVLDTNFDGNGDSIDLNGTSIIAGELDQAGVNRLERALLRFVLPAIPDGETITSATLRLYVTGVPSTATDPASLYWSNDGKTLANTYSSSFYQNSTFVSTGLQVASTATTAGTWVELNVTSFVKDDYASADSVGYSWFRIQVDGLVFAEDNVSRRYGFASDDHADASLRPQLLITTAIPEPSAYGAILALAAVAWATTRRRRTGN